MTYEDILTEEGERALLASCVEADERDIAELNIALNGFVANVRDQGLEVCISRVPAGVTIYVGRPSDKTNRHYLRRLVRHLLAAIDSETETENG